MVSELRKKSEEKMARALDAVKKEFQTLRTGRASLGILEGIMVDYYGTPSHISQVANLSVPEPRQIIIQPWEPKMLGEIEKAILKSDIGLTPSNDGKIIRLNIPPLTEERRHELVRVVRTRTEESRVAARNVRRDVQHTLREFEKEKLISEDDLRRGEEDLQKITDRFVEQINEVGQHKETEVLEV